MMLATSGQREPVLAGVLAFEKNVFCAAAWANVDAAQAQRSSTAGLERLARHPTDAAGSEAPTNLKLSRRILHL